MSELNSLLLFLGIIPGPGINLGLIPQETVRSFCLYLASIQLLVVMSDQEEGEQVCVLMRAGHQPGSHISSICHRMPALEVSTAGKIYIHSHT